MVTREDAIEVLKKTVGNINYDAEREEIYFTDQWVQAYEMAIAALREHPQWISVEDELPSLDATKTDDFGRQKSVRVLCVCKQKSGKVFVKEGYYVVCAGDDVYWKIPGSIDSVTHWMPLPTPPEVEV